MIRSLRRDGDPLFGVPRPAAAAPGAVVDPRTLVLGEVPGPAEPAGRLGPDAVADGTLRSRLADDPPGLVVYAPAGGGDPGRRTARRSGRGPTVTQTVASSA
ncbi:hypothetical protein [Pseudonocardia alni]|uniref:Uncharacterized protein n=1 Tax=Pseudonocardia alni subsp. carboxydivorans TaxID=415010 RepID=A0ABU9AL32_PSEA5